MSASSDLHNIGGNFNLLIAKIIKFPSNLVKTKLYKLLEALTEAFFAVFRANVFAKYLNFQGLTFRRKIKSMERSRHMKFTFNVD